MKNDQEFPPLTSQEAKDYDGLVWGVEEDGTLFTGFNVKETKKKKPKPHELGYRYNILCFKECDDKSIDVFEAIIGDPYAYALGLSRVGFNGIMFKSKFLTKAEMQDGFGSALKNYGFSTTVVNSILKKFK